MVLNVFASIAANTIAIASFVSVTTFCLAVCRLLPTDLQVSVGEGIGNLGAYVSLAPNAAVAMGVQPINWYGRGNVLYQVGRTMTDYDLVAQRNRSERAFTALSRFKTA